MKCPNGTFCRQASVALISIGTLGGEERKVPINGSGDRSGPENQLGTEDRRISRNPVFPLFRYRQIVPVESGAAILVAVVRECDFGADSLRSSRVLG